MEILREFQGILGAIIGVVVTLITTQYIRRFGKVRVDSFRSSVKFQKQINNMGSISEVDVDGLEQADIFNYEFEFAFYNATDLPKNYYDIRVQFIDANNSKFSVVPYDKTKQMLDGARWHNEKISFIKLNPKELNIIKIYGWIHKEEFLTYTRTAEIKKAIFIAKDSKGRNFHRKLYG